MKDLRFIFSSFGSHVQHDFLRLKPQKGHMLWPPWWGTAYAKDIPGKGRYYVDARGKHMVKI